MNRETDNARIKKMGKLYYTSLHSKCFSNWHKSMLIALSVISPYSWATTTIEPPVTPTEKQKATHNNPITFELNSSIVSNFLWRGISITQQQPGWSTQSTVNFYPRRISSFLTLNAYSYTAGPDPVQTTNTYTDIAYMMTESKLGLKMIIGSLETSSSFLSIAHGIFNWPGSSVWQYSAKTISQTGHIKPIKSTDLFINWLGFKILYSISDSSLDKDPSSAETSLGGKLWEDYFHLQTSDFSLNKYYSFNIEYGYLKHTGRHFDLSLNYAFNNHISASLKGYNFKSYSTYFSNSYGATTSLNYHFK